MRIAYADPPYPGCAHLYKDHPDYAGEVDHAKLVYELCHEYDGYCLHAAWVTETELQRLVEQYAKAEQDAETLSDLVDALRVERDDLKEQVETLEKEIARLKTDRGMWHHEPIPASEGNLGTPTANQSERTEPLPARES